MSNILDDLTDESGELAAPFPGNDLPDPTPAQRVVGVVAGIAAYAVIFSVSQILVLSRVPSHFILIAGLALLIVSVLGFVGVRALVLLVLGSSSLKLSLPRPNRWLTNGAIGVVAVLASSVLYVFLLSNTSISQLGGEYGSNVYELPTQASQQALDEWESGNRIGDLIYGVIDTKGALDIINEPDEVRPAIEAAVPVLESIAAELDSLDWPSVNDEIKDEFVGGVYLMAEGYRRAIAAIDASDDDELDEALELVDFAETWMADVARRYTEEN